jgi:hypothetical protein
LAIEQHRFDSWPLFRVDPPGDSPGNSKYWKILTRVVRIESVLRGEEAQRVVNVYEIFWTGGASGPWNATQNGERAVFLVRKEGGRYHVVRDWWRSIFPISRQIEAPAKLPLDASSPLWERVALMNWWFGPAATGSRLAYGVSYYPDPGGVLTLWRLTKLQRGLLRRPSSQVRIGACRQLLLLQSWAQDECWEMLSAEEQGELREGGYYCCTSAEVEESRRKAEQLPAERQWRIYNDPDSRRLLTAINNRRLREQFCRLWQRDYPGDNDNRCPADRPPPATIVTAAQGDVPLVGRWPPSLP